MRKPAYLLIGILVLFLLVFYNYLLAQKAIKNQKPAPLDITLTSFPEDIKASSSAIFMWHINATPDLSTNFTTIYWGHESSPSALTKKDSPQAVGYPNSLPDYAAGHFALPDDFNVNIKFDKPGKIFFRAYAKVGADHLWSEEEALNVSK